MLDKMVPILKRYHLWQFFLTTNSGIIIEGILGLEGANYLVYFGSSFNT